MQKIFFDSLKPEAERDPRGVAAARQVIDMMLPTYDQHFEKRTWALGEHFTMADCAAAPVLNYMRMVHPFEQYKHLVAYANRPHVVYLSARLGCRVYQPVYGVDLAALCIRRQA